MVETIGHSRLGDVGPMVSKGPITWAICIGTWRELWVGPHPPFLVPWTLYSLVSHSWIGWRGVLATSWLRVTFVPGAEVMAEGRKSKSVAFDGLGSGTSIWPLRLAGMSYEAILNKTNGAMVLV